MNNFRVCGKGNMHKCVDSCVYLHMNIFIHINSLSYGVKYIQAHFVPFLCFDVSVLSSDTLYSLFCRHRAATPQLDDSSSDTDESDFEHLPRKVCQYGINTALNLNTAL